jgi:N-alpha-acetyltransferase 35, NatC auxiliary subunit
MQAEWHAGATLSQSVYTFMYMHELDVLSPDLMSTIPDEPDPARPRGLLSYVLRAGTFGYLKCIDLAWREMNKGRVVDVGESLCSSAHLFRLLYCGY